jgi:excisionase family DNA binding protein
MTDVELESNGLIGIRDVAKLLGCSERHVTNLVREGRIPSPIKLGRLVRWSQQQLAAWIEGECQPVCVTRVTATPNL